MRTSLLVLLASAVSSAAVAVPLLATGEVQSQALCSVTVYDETPGVYPGGFRVKTNCV